MAESVSALGGAASEGLVRVAEIAPLGMVSLRGDLGQGALRAVVAEVTGYEVPPPLTAAGTSSSGVGWMSPDELLLFVAPGSAAVAVERIDEALADIHHLALDVSDARAALAIEGAASRDVLAKVTPIDLHPSAAPLGSFRRTRLAQIPAAIWIGEGGATVLCFRAVARYAFDVISTSARPGGEVEYY